MARPLAAALDAGCLLDEVCHWRGFHDLLIRKLLSSISCREPGPHYHVWLLTDQLRDLAVHARNFSSKKCADHDTDVRDS